MSQSLIHPTERVLALRRIGFFRQLSEQLIATIAHHTRVELFRAGTVLFDEEHPPDRMSIVVDGRIRIERGGKHILDVPVGYGVGALSLFFYDNTVVTRAVAPIDTLVLSIDHDTYMGLLEDHFDLVSAPLRGMSAEIIEMADELGGQTQLGTNTMIVPGPEPLDLVERIFALIQGDVFKESSLEVVAGFAERLTEVRFAPGEQLWARGDAPDGALLLVHGEVHVTGDGWIERCYDGAWLGALSTNALRPRRGTAVAQRECVALAASSELLFDVLEDNFGLAKHFWRS